MHTAPRRPRRGGFTYIEVTLTFAIIAILAAIAVPNFLEAQIRADVARVRTDMAVVKSAIETYRFEHGQWPLNRQAGTPDRESLDVLTTPVAYLTRLPPDRFMSPRQGPALIMPFSYLNGLQAFPETGLRLIDPIPSALFYTIPATGEINTQPISHFGEFVRVLLIAAGPSTNIRPSEPLTIGPEGEINIVRYDPTNGTNSWGDLYQPVP